MHDLSVPNEIVDIILTLSIPKELTDFTPGSGKVFRAFLKCTGVRDYPRLLKQVCRKWRTLVNRNATKYMVLHLRLRGSKRWIWVFPEHYKEPLALSKDKPLSLVCILGNVGISEVLSSPLFAPRLSPEALREGSDAGARGASRTDGIDGSWEYYSDWRGILHSAPRLSEASLLGFRHGLDGFFLAYMGPKAGIDWSRLTCTVFCHLEDEDLCSAEFSEPLSDSENDWSEVEEEAGHTEEDQQDAAARRIRELHLEVARHPDYEPDDSWRGGRLHYICDSDTEDIEEYEDALDTQEHGAGTSVLVPLLSDLIERFRCIIRHLSLSRLFVSLSELLGIIELCHHLRSLHLDRPLRFMRGSLLDGLAARNGRLLAPELRRLVIESRTQTIWPLGWSETDVAYVKVVHCPSSEYDPRRKHSKDALEATTRAWLAWTRARRDIQVDIEELTRSRVWDLESRGSIIRRQIGNIRIVGGGITRRECDTFKPPPAYSLGAVLPSDRCVASASLFFWTPNVVLSKLLSPGGTAATQEHVLRRRRSVFIFPHPPMPRKSVNASERLPNDAEIGQLNGHCSIDVDA
ncbi:hypothetical protein K525DRAFT_248934 [Schizophyllum commune Loenen D]|nr:hypothetical protein K525DRAFT_248934 [Schizophyllum commune Loenen D]